MALVHKALAVQKKERAKLAEEQAKLAVVEARLDELAYAMEKMQEAGLEAGCFAGLQTEEGYGTFGVTGKHPKEELDRIVESVKSR